MQTYILAVGATKRALILCSQFYRVIITHDMSFEQNRMSTSLNRNAEFRLKTTVGLWRGISILCGVIIGSGIFITPGGILSNSLVNFFISCILMLY